MEGLGCMTPMRRECGSTLMMLFWLFIMASVSNCCFCSFQSNAPGQASQGIEVDGTHGNANGQRQEGNQAQPSQPFQSLPQVMQFPVPGGAGPAPQIQVVVTFQINGFFRLLLISLSL